MLSFVRSIVAVVALVAFLVTNAGIAMASVAPVAAADPVACAAPMVLHGDHSRALDLHDDGCAASTEKSPFDHHNAGAGSPCCALNCHAAISVACPDTLVTLAIGKAIFPGLHPQPLGSVARGLERPPRTILG
ncbi:hypothetical protein [Devosia soli]|nr:hypothetical protein [Devosia soli]